MHLLVSENTVRKIVKLVHIEHFGLSKKAAMVSNFCLIGTIHHNFLAPRMIELRCKTFMPFQALDLHRVLCIVQTKKLTGIDFVDFFDKRPKLKIPTAI